jgi:hypothetical protein
MDFSHFSKPKFFLLVTGVLIVVSLTSCKKKPDVVEEFVPRVYDIPDFEDPDLDGLPESDTGLP